MRQRKQEQGCAQRREEEVRVFAKVAKEGDQSLTARLLRACTSASTPCLSSPRAPREADRSTESRGSTPLRPPILRRLPACLLHAFPHLYHDALPTVSPAVHTDPCYSENIPKDLVRLT